MATNPDSTAPLSTVKKENITPIASNIASKIAELNETRSELLGRIQSLKQDLQGRRSKFDSEVKVYREVSDDQCFFLFSIYFDSL
ncbi:hypothetical protein RIF29_04006 [Crotalaria pallida]|uniref:Uncharacterized protein n=1 Tax=Crotalaria pallida TaxID=3830 RepID=A0AAN9J0K3_CROPI